MAKLRSTIALLLSVLLAGCGGHSPWSGHTDNNTGAPSEPLELTANAGDGAVSLGWTAPTTNGSGSITYNVAISPAASAAQITIDSTTALIRGLTNNTTYTFSVTATNSSGTGPAAPIQATPATVASSDYSQVSMLNETDGVSEPSLLHAASGAIWMAYSAVSFNNSGQFLSSATRLARSTDGGISYTFNIEIGTPGAAQNICGTSCTGTWEYRTPWLIEDSSDPDATRRFKLFAHKYFFDTSNNIPNYQLGTIVMWTAASPDGTWSQEQSLLNWGNAPTLAASINITALNSTLSSCVWIGEGSATIYSGGIDLVFSCALDNTTFPSRSIVLLRSTDHLTSLSYIATLLQPADAATFSADSFSAPVLLSTAGNAPVMIATPIDITNNVAAGCVIFPIANEQTGKLFTDTGAPLALQVLPSTGNDSGSCAWDRGLITSGILMSDRSGSTYTLKATGKSL